MLSVLSCVLLAAMASARPEGGHSKAILHHPSLFAGHRGQNSGFGQEYFGHESRHQAGHQSFSHHDVAHQSLGHRNFGHQSIGQHGGYEAPVRHGGYGAPVHHGGYEGPVHHGGYEGPVRHGGYGPDHHDDHYVNKDYGFEYTVQDPYSGAEHGHTEQRDGYVTKGAYFVDLPDGRRQTVTYTADEYGYHPVVTYDGEANYDVHAGHGNSYEDVGNQYLRPHHLQSVCQ
ncbi:cuticle protein 19 [Hyalella azteca]|uniref:Cuticle protein 19 n=1 Tax=Hyalella azteca TaxID=294128 RepID=A0A8B7NX94_HYAAZ|nr:cuticle protein 19 [Hyalella azteca]